MTKEEIKIYNRNYELLNREKRNEKKKEWKNKNKVKVTQYQKEYNEKYQKINKLKIDLNKKIYSEKNKDKIKEYQKNYYEKNKDKLRLYYNNKKNELKKYYKLYREKNVDKIKEQQKNYNKKRRAEDPLYKLSIRIRNAFNQSFKNNNYKKHIKTIEILGCTFEEFKIYLESRFESWMNWQNRGLYNGQEQYGWDIDHIIPLSFAKTEEDIIKLNHYTNLQPLCSYMNRVIKRKKLI